MRVLEGFGLVPEGRDPGRLKIPAAGSREGAGPRASSLREPKARRTDPIEWIVVSSRSRLRRMALALATFLVGLALARPAAAYVRTQSTRTGVPVYWTDPRIALVLSHPPASFDIGAEQIAAALRTTLAAWSAPAIPCTGLALALVGDLADQQVVGRDRRNRLVIRTDRWCSADDDCNSAGEVALTSQFYLVAPGEPQDGRIVESDIEINAVHHQWALIPDEVAGANRISGRLDLASAITHEVGHLIGLAHNCTLPGEPPAGTIDDGGDPVLPCAEADPSLIEATMYPSLGVDEIGLRTLSADDERAACDIYPTTSRPIEIFSGGGGGCSAAGSEPSSQARHPWLRVWIVFCAAWAVTGLRRGTLLRVRQHGVRTVDPQGAPDAHR